MEAQPEHEAAAADASAQDTTLDAELPKAAVKRIVKAKLSKLAESAAGDKKAGTMQIKEDALLAFHESARVFISYLTATAVDLTKEAKRVTMQPDDIFKALEEIDFGELVQPLKEFLEAHKSAAKEKNSKKKAAEGGSARKPEGSSASARKRKSEAAQQTPAGKQQNRSNADKDQDDTPAPAAGQGAEGAEDAAVDDAGAQDATEAGAAAGEQAAATDADGDADMAEGNA